jgi:uncharacterized SAM-binding protein YcdF (DUF218 family)
MKVTVMSYGYILEYLKNKKMEFELEINAAAKTIWNYHNIGQKPGKADLILVLCSHDLRVAEYAAKLMMQDYAPLMMFSGGIAHGDDLLATSWGMPEAEKFAEIAIEKGVPKEKILVENRATNTGENIANSFLLMSEKGISCKKIILVQKPYMLRRTFAVFMKQWPGEKVEIILTAPEISFEDYARDEVERDRFINIMVGDLQRIREYPEKGFQIYQEIPGEVQRAYEKLVGLGYTKHLIK